MEDMARLALVEQNVRDVEKFSKILYELLRHINHILENPNDYELRIIRSEVLKTVLKYEAFVDYLKSIGFKPVGSDFTYPKEHTLSKLRMAQAAIERKIYFCCGSLNHSEGRVKSGMNLGRFMPGAARKYKLLPVNVLNTTNPFLLKLQTLFNDVLKYENEELQALAREQIPIVTLQLMALDRCREHQRKIKAGETKARDLPFDIALLMELLGWFKYKFFSWVDQPQCDLCGGPTVHNRNSNLVIENETCRVEHYKCTRCADGSAQFARYNDVRTLLRTRRGRCGEWANCFALLCRAMGYDTRYVYDTTDHVWCEIYDYDSNTWLHVDPCEGKLDAPLLYSHGWGKQLAYVIAFSRDDLQDVTWRYTTQHRQVLKRRTLCSEKELTNSIMLLREARKRQVSEARQRCLTKRCLEELVQLMVERKPGDSESHGRISGSAAWRRERGELGKQGHVFRFIRPGPCGVQYCTAADKYTVTGGADSDLHGWANGVYSANSVFRKVELDWRMVYLAREEGAVEGVISWRVEASAGAILRGLKARLHHATYEDATVEFTIAADDLPAKTCVLTEGAIEGVISWRVEACSGAILRGLRARLHHATYEDATVEFTLAADDLPAKTCVLSEGALEGVISRRVEACAGAVLRGLRARLHHATYEDATVEFTIAADDLPAKSCVLSESWTQLSAQCSTATLHARMRGGRGDLAWQHAQLFRQPLDDNRPMLDIAATLDIL